MKERAGSHKEPLDLEVSRNILILSSVLLVVPTLGAVETVSHEIPKIETKISLDGALDEAVWNKAWTMTLDYEVLPGENTPAPTETEVLVFHDQTRLYVGFRSLDPEPSSIRAHLSDRDNLGPDDAVGVILDTFNDERRNYLFLVNPVGVQSDTIETMDGNTPWDGIWASAAIITDWGWSAELEIPFSTLRFQRSEGAQTWGFDAIRLYPRNLSHQMGTFARDRSNNCYLCQAHKIDGFAGVSPGRNLEIVPTLTGLRSDARDELPDGRIQPGDPEIELGATVRWGFTPNLTLSAALNPDFSQIEADALQLRVNRPFAIFFPELRPFFMEGADFFDTGMDAVYTRMMREPAWGLKLTGKEGGHTIGAYVVSDQVTNIIIPGSETSAFTSLEQKNLSTVARYRYDIGNRFTLGGLYTGRQGTDYYNRVAGVDGDLRLSPKDRILAQALFSNTRYPNEVVRDFDQPEGDFDDWAAEIIYLHNTRTWEWWAVYSDIGTDFRADLGFMPWVDRVIFEGGLGYTWNATDTSWYSKLNLKSKIAHVVDQTGFVLFHEDVIQFTLEGPMQSHSVMRPSHVREGFNGREFEFNRLKLHFCARPNGHSNIWLNLTVGGQVDYANTRPGDFVLFDGSIFYRFGRHLFIEPKYTRERMEVDDGWLYTTSIGQLEASWQFNPRCFVRAIFQYVDDQFNPDLYSDGRGPEYKRFFTQLLFSYKVNPRTVLFFGYSENSAATRDYSFTQTDRTIFAKVGYAWVL
jgi:hypothetical protein